MEKQDFDDFVSICKHLIDYLEKNNLKPNPQQKQVVTESIINLIKSRKAAGMKDVLRVYHYFKEHQGSYIKFPCNSAHCIECYNDLVSGELYIQKETVCTCSGNIAPVTRKKIIENYTRIQGLKTLCNKCGQKKDIMNFTLKNNHKCSVCLDCIKLDFDYDRNENSCSLCNEKFDEESDMLVRSVLESTMNEKDVANHYRTNCPKCNQNGDRREFMQSCKDKCTACKNCVEARSKGENTCWCGLEISMIR